MSEADVIRDVFEKNKTFAVYGMSANPDKPAHSVPVYLMSKGFKIIPINPGAEKIAGQKSYAKLHDVEERIDVLEVFRPSEQALGVVKEAVERRKAKGDIHTIWLQLGIRSEEAKQLAESEGISFVQDKCMYVEHRKLFPD
jgi:predicted CoA-binding protein